MVRLKFNLGLVLELGLRLRLELEYVLRLDSV